MQVLELAGRALEDQVSEGGHAQVGAALQGAQGPTQPGCATYQGIPQTPKSWPALALTSSSQYFRITSRALSVISGASSTTLVKTLPGEEKGRGHCRRVAAELGAPCLCTPKEPWAVKTFSSPPKSPLRHQGPMQLGEVLVALHGGKEVNWRQSG